jgi:multicomponent Na+:H+ antiporter subunit D
VASSAWAAQAMPVIIAGPIVVACLLIAAGHALPRRVIDILATGTAVAVTGLGAALVFATSHSRVVMWAGRWRPAHGLSVGIPLIADPLNAGLVLLAGGLMSCALLYSWRFIESVHGRFHALMLLFLAGMSGFALSGDVFDMFVFFELMGAAGYALTGMKIEDKTAVQGALIFGIMNSFGAYLSLAGVAIVYSRTGQLGLPQLGELLSRHHPDALVITGFVLIITGFLVKGAEVPFHFWLADAHAVAPTPVCVLLSGVMVELGLYGVARVYWAAFSGTLPAGDVRRAFLVLGTLTALLGAVMCYMQRHMKRLLAYSTIAHVGLFTTAFATLSEDGTAGAAIYVAGHAGVKAALFLIVGVLLDQHGNVDEHRLYGCGKKDRAQALLYFAAALGLAGLPPFGTALGKLVSEDALASAGYPWAPLLYVVVSAVTGGAVLRAGLRIYFGLGPQPPVGEPGPAEETSGAEEEPDTRLSGTPATMMVAIIVLIAGSLAAGVLPDAGAAFGAAAHRFTDATGYVQQALFHAARAAPPAAPPASTEPSWTAAGIGLDLLSVLLAFAAAWLGIFGRRLPSAVRAAGRPAAPAVLLLHRLHSGHIGDYVAWLFAGIAALTALLAFPLM